MNPFPCMKTSTTPLKAFTLVELLMVIAMLMTLAAMLMMSVQKCSEIKRQIVCLSNLRQLYICWTLYSSENGGRLVPTPEPGAAWYSTSDSSFYASNSWPFLLRQYLRMTAIGETLSFHPRFNGLLRCPSHNYQPSNEEKIPIYMTSYGLSLYGVGGNVQPGLTPITTTGHIKYPAEQMVFLETSAASHYDVPSCYCPGHDGYLACGVHWFNANFCHRGKANVVFADGHVAGRTREQLEVSMDTGAPNYMGTSRFWGNPL